MRTAFNFNIQHSNRSYGISDGNKTLGIYVGFTGQRQKIICLSDRYSSPTVWQLNGALELRTRSGLIFVRLAHHSHAGTRAQTQTTDIRSRVVRQSNIDRPITAHDATIVLLAANGNL